MSNRLWISRLLCLFLIAATLALGGCKFYGDKERTWTEDVSLDDGTQVQIQRHVKFTDHNSLGGGSYGANETESTLQLQDQGSALPTWSDALIPLVLYRSATGEWVIVATTSACRTWLEHGAPIPPYWEYRIQAGQWRRVDVSQESIGRKANLFSGYNAGLPAEHVTNEIKLQDRAIGGIGKSYLQVLSAAESADYCRMWRREPSSEDQLQEQRN
jgi:hypothetical protein